MAFILTAIWNEGVLKIDYMIFKLAKSGSYGSSDYIMNMAFSNLIGLILYILGIVTITYLVLIKKED